MTKKLKHVTTRPAGKVTRSLKRLVNSETDLLLLANVYSGSSRSVESNKRTCAHLGESNMIVDLVSIELDEENPSDDKYIFLMSATDLLVELPLEFSRVKLEERFSSEELKTMMLKSLINGRCKIGGDFFCERCEFEDNCNEQRERLAMAKIPANASLTQVRAIMASPEFYKGLTSTCWKVEEAVALRMLLEVKCIEALSLDNLL